MGGSPGRREVHHGKQEHASLRRAGTVSHAGLEDEHVAWRERILAVPDVESRVAFEQLNRDRSVRLVWRQRSVSRDRHHRQSKRSILHERSRSPPVARQQVLIDELLVALQMMDEDVTFDWAAQRRHVTLHDLGQQSVPLSDGRSVPASYRRPVPTAWAMSVCEMTPTSFPCSSTNRRRASA